MNNPNNTNSATTQQPQSSKKACEPQAKQGEKPSVWQPTHNRAEGIRGNSSGFGRAQDAPTNDGLWSPLGPRQARVPDGLRDAAEREMAARRKYHEDDIIKEQDKGAEMNT